MFEAPSQTGVKWMLLDLNSYFASCEQQANPALRGRPVAVVPMETDSTCAIAASYEAKAYGIKTGTKIWEAKQRCPELICVMARHDLYVRYHHQVLEEVVKHVPLGKVWSIDEVASKLPPLKQNVESAIKISRNIKEGLRRNVGECLTASIGFAPNGFLAKLASDMQKPDGLTILEGHNLEERLTKLSLRALCGIGPNMEARLNRAGIWTMKQLWDLHPKQMRALWRSVEGEKFWYRLHGYEVPEIETEKSVIGHSRVLDMDSRKPSVAMEICRRLTVKACQRLRRYEMYATHFSMSVRTTDDMRWGHDIRLAPTDDTMSFIRITHAFWGLMLDSLHPHAIKKVSITLSGLQTAAETTGDLFAPVNVRKTKNIALSKAMDAIAQSFGPHAVHFGNQPKTQAGFVGTKIAFSRVPELVEFSE